MVEPYGALFICPLPVFRPHGMIKVFTFYAFSSHNPETLWIIFTFNINHYLPSAIYLTQCIKQQSLKMTPHLLDTEAADM